MGFKAIKQHYDIGYIVAIYNEEKYGGVPGLFTGL